MLFRLLLPLFQDNFTGGLEEKLRALVGQGDDFALGTTVRKANELRRFALRLEKAATDAMVSTMFAYVAIIFLVCALTSGLSWFGWFGAFCSVFLTCVICFSFDIRTAKAMQEMIRESALDVGLECLARSGDGAVKKMISSERCKPVVGFFGKMEAGGDGEVFTPYDWIVQGLRGAILVGTVMDPSGRYLGALRFVDYVRGYSSDVGKLFGKAVRSRKYGLGFMKRTFRSAGSSTDDDAGDWIPMEAVDDADRLSEFANPPRTAGRRRRLTVAGLRRYFAQRNPVPSRAAQLADLCLGNAQGVATTSVLVGLSAYGAYKLANGEGFRRPKPVTKPTQEEKARPVPTAKAGGKAKVGKKEGAMSTIKEFLFPGSSRVPEIPAKLVEETTRINGEILACKKANTAEAELKVVDLVAERQKLWLAWNHSHPDVAKNFKHGDKKESSRPKPTKAQKQTAEANRGAFEAQGKLKKSGKSGDNRWWCYEDDETGKDLWVYLNEDTGTYWEDFDRDKLRMFMAERFDDYMEDEMTHDEYRADKRDRYNQEREQRERIDYETNREVLESGKSKSEPALSKSKAAKNKAKKERRKARLLVSADVPGPSTSSGKKESSLSKCSVDSSKVKILIMRNKTNHKNYQNAPIIQGNVLVYKHLFGVSEASKVKIDEWELHNVQNGKDYPLTVQPQGCSKHEELLFFPAPANLKSTVYKRNTVEGKAVEPCVVMGYDSFDSEGISVSAGEAYSKTARHNGASREGWCGALVLAQSGETPRLMGFHLYGDDGTGTNGYVPLTEELNDELKAVRFSKN